MVQVEEKRNQNTQQDTCRQGKIELKFSPFYCDISRKFSGERQFFCIGNEKPQENANNARNNQQLAHDYNNASKLIQLNHFLLVNYEQG